MLNARGKEKSRITEMKCLRRTQAMSVMDKFVNQDSKTSEENDEFSEPNGREKLI